MLKIKIPAVELFDERSNSFITLEKEGVLTLEHSLVSLSKWESKWQKPFMTKQEKTEEETLDYIKCMTITQNVDPELYENIKYCPNIIQQVNDYIANPMTATTFSEDKTSKPNREIVTSELIYFWMFSYGIPMDCQKWHLNRLLTLVRVFTVKNQTHKPLGKKATASKYAALNAARKKQLNTKG